MSEDPYLQSDGRTLKNKVGIAGDPDFFLEVETGFVAQRAAEIRAHGVPSGEGFGLLKAIHKHLFQDIYDWAGRPRSTNLFKPEFEGSPFGTRFPPPGQIEWEATRIFSDLAAEGQLRGLSKGDFIERLSDYFSRVNMLHAFREGNGRAQRILWQHIAQQAGFKLDFEGITSERMVAVSIAGGRGDLVPIRRMFGELLNPEQHLALVTAIRFLASASRERSGFSWNDRYIATTTPERDYKGIFVGAGAPNFLFAAGDRIYVGKLQDLPASGVGLVPGAQIAFKAGGPAAMVPEPLRPLSVEDYWAGFARKGQGSPSAAAEQTETLRETRGPKLR
jgi:cell filamentation protein